MKYSLRPGRKYRLRFRRRQSASYAFVVYECVAQLIVVGPGELTTWGFAPLTLMYTHLPVSALLDYEPVPQETRPYFPIKLRVR